MNQLPIVQYLEAALNAAVQAGKKILTIYESIDAFEVSSKADNSPLTAADKAGHLRITELLESTGLPVLSEEGKSIDYEVRKKWPLYWLIDPLDGTKEFIKRNGEFTVNIALIEQEKVIAGVVYVPVTDILYWGSIGGGAFKRVGNNPPISLPLSQSDNIKAIVASRSHMSPETEAFIANYPEAELLSMGSSLKFLLVAEGKAQLYPRFAPTMEWDTAAAQAVVEAAGGQVVWYPQNTPLNYNRPDMLNGWFLVKARGF